MSTIQLLSDFVAQRPGFSLADYGSYSAYRSDYRVANSDLNAYYELLNIARVWYGAELDAALTKALERSSGCLTMEAGKLQYVTGQYFPTEYRGAACRVLVSLIWEALRRETRPDGSPVYPTGDAIRQAIRRRSRSRAVLAYFR